MKTINRFKVSVILLALLSVVQAGFAQRIMDITTIKGVRGNPLSGIGIVTGLNGTGDKSKLSSQIITNILRRSNLVVSPSDLSTGSVAVVMVTAELGPFDSMGSKIDVNVSTFQDATSLQGGELYMTELKGADGETYALANGSIFLGGFAASGSAASTTKNHTTAGRVPDGATVEREEIATFVDVVGSNRFITLNLRNKDFSTAVNIQNAINQRYPGIAAAKNAGAVTVGINEALTEDQVSGFISNIGSLTVEVDMPAVVIINEKTGTIIVGEKVGISACAVAQGSLIVKVKESAFVSQPQAPFSGAGETAVVPDTSLDVVEEEGHLIPIDKSITVTELAKALNSIGASPRDLIAIFNALKAGGHLQAELKMM